MIQILAHRANLNGPHSVRENSLEACARALDLGFGLETDLRRAPEGGFYISHDPAPPTPDNRLAGYSALFKRYPAAELAINVKELGDSAALVELMLGGGLGTSAFYFDFELLQRATPGAAQRELRGLPGGDRVRLATRLSDRNEPPDQCLAIPGEIVWADEFDRLWLTAEEVRRVRAAGRRFYVISPELHGFPEADRLQRWSDFRAWGVDGLCTDFPLAAREFFGG